MSFSAEKSSFTPEITNKTAKILESAPSGSRFAASAPRMQAGSPARMQGRAVGRSTRRFLRWEMSAERAQHRKKSRLMSLGHRKKLFFQSVMSF